MMNDKSLKIFRLVPDAPETDPNWDRAKPVGEVVVRAYSPADARVVAAQAETDFLDLPTKPGDGVSTDFASAFRDEKLYRVIEDTSGEFPDAGSRGLVSALPQCDTLLHAGDSVKPGKA